MQEKRFNEIQNYLKNHEICTYEELREYCDVSLSTIKRDIDFLDAEGRLLRIRGGARRLPSDPSSLAQEQQPIEMLKYEPNLDRIAKKACELVTNNDIVFLGSGVTVAHMVRHLSGFKYLTVITNSIYVMQEAFHYNIDVMMIGGMLNRGTMSYSGIQSINQLKGLNANIAFMSCNGIAISHGITNSSEVEGDVKKVAIQISGNSVLLVDHNKFDKISLHTIAEMKDISTVITNKTPDFRYIKEANDGHTELIVVDEEV